jgi:hypothetical protein
MGFAAMAKMAAQAAAKEAQSVAKNMAKNAVGEMKAAAKAKGQQMTQNAIKFGTSKLNSAQANAAKRMGAMAVGVQAGAPVMVGPRGANFRMNARGQRLPMLQ